MDKIVSAMKSVTANESAFITHMINTHAPEYRVGRIDTPFITFEALPVTDDDLRRLHAHGIIILRFKTVRECRFIQALVRTAQRTTSVRWLSNEGLRTVLRENAARLGADYLGEYSPLGSAAPAHGAALAVQGSAAAPGLGWRSWLPPFIPGSKWKESQGKGKGGNRGKGRKRTGKRVPTKKVKRRTRRCHCRCRSK